ncbi:unnamed protein product [Pleuronectes platessa]|uniref:Uncharacterized protein n=1 Tax=Pleuronectes platessa TaxID=8262 RepID=A0A9N7VLT8_PLEPL|nr:unnamed protein product [Pleuronectes platessa]
MCGGDSRAKMSNVHRVYLQAKNKRTRADVRREIQLVQTVFCPEREKIAWTLLCRTGYVWHRGRRTRTLKERERAGHKLLTDLQEDNGAERGGVSRQDRAHKT